MIGTLITCASIVFGAWFFIRIVEYFGCKPGGGKGKDDWAGVVALDHPFDQVRVCLKGLDAARSYAKDMGADVDTLNPK